MLNYKYMLCVSIIQPINLLLFIKYEFEIVFVIAFGEYRENITYHTYANRGIIPYSFKKSNKKWLFAVVISNEAYSIPIESLEFISKDN